MTLQFTGVIKEAFERKEGISARTNLRWMAQKFYIEEQTDRQWKDGVIVEVRKEQLADWMVNNVGTIVTVDFSIRRDDYNDNAYNKVTCFGCSYNGVKVGIEPQDNDEVDDTPF